MRRSAGEFIRNLEARVARLENKTASSMSALAFNSFGDEIGSEIPVACVLNPKDIASCIKREFGCVVDTTKYITITPGNAANPTMVKVPCTPRSEESNQIAFVAIYLKNNRTYPLG